MMLLGVVTTPGSRSLPSCATLGLRSIHSLLELASFCWTLHDCVGSHASVSLWQGATACVPLVFSQHCITSLPLNYYQMVSMTKRGRDEGHGVPPCLPLQWCSAASPARHPWSSPAAAASFPGTEPSLRWPLLHSDLGKRESDHFRVKAFVFLCSLMNCLLSYSGFVKFSTAFGDPVSFCEDEILGWCIFQNLCHLCNWST